VHDVPKKPPAPVAAKEPGEYTALAGEWLTHYARLRQRAPKLAERLAQQGDEFELVPVPRRLLQTLAAPGADPSLTLADLLTRDADAAAGDGGPLTLAKAFADAMAAGSATDVKVLLSPGYLDGDGRRANEIGAALDHFLSGKTGRSCTVLDAAEVQRTPGNALVRLRLAWSETAAGAAARQEEVTLELLVERDAAGLWKIASIVTR
jgi:hypothetical protein